MLRFIAFILLLLVIAMVYPGCCPRIVNKNNSTGVIDTTDLFEPDSITIPERNFTHEIDFAKICDSLSKGKSSEFKQKGTSNSIIVRVETSGKGTITCKEDSLKILLDSARHKQVIKIDSSHFTQVEIFKCDKKFHTFSIGWFWATVAVLLVFIAAKLSFKKF